MTGVQTCALPIYFKRRWVNDYLSRLAAAGFPERREKLHPALKKYVEVPVEAAAA